MRPPARAIPGPKAKPAAEKTLSERGLTIRLYPQKPKVALYGTRIVSAWLCPANDKTPFGGAIASDGKPGTKDDDCRPVRVKWSVTDGAGARLSNSIGYKTRVTLTAKHPNRLVAEVGDLKRPSALVILDKPQKNRPNADQVREQVKQQKQAKQTKPAPKPVAPKVEQPSDNVNVEQPVAEDPTEEPTAEPAVEEPTAEPAVEDPTEEPAVEAPRNVEPAEEPVAEDPTEEPAAETPAKEPAPQQPKAAKEPDIPGTAGMRAPATKVFKASAASITTQVAGRMRDGTLSECRTYDPQATSTSTYWVPRSSGGFRFWDIAWMAHGRTSGYGGECRTELTIISGNKQSAIGFSPVTTTASPTTSVTPGSDFLLGMMWHANNPIVDIGVEPRYFKGTMDVRLDLAGTVKDYDFDWTLWETDNGGPHPTTS